MMRSFRIFIFLSLPLQAAFTERQKKSKPVHKGNFLYAILPGNTFAFGQNIFEKKTLVFYPTFSQLAGKDSSTIKFFPAFIYAFTNDLSLYVGLPIVPKDKENSCTLRGIGSMFVQLEYAFINQTTSSAQNLATIVANIGLPTTHLSPKSCDMLSTCSNTSAPTSFFIGTTASRTAINWYVYGTLGAQFNTTKNDFKPGTELFYQFGIGHFIANIGRCCATGILECNGIWTQKDTSCNTKDENSGGHLFYIGPTISFSANRWSLSGGIQAAAIQRLNGCQNKNHYRTQIQATWVF